MGAPKSFRVAHFVFLCRSPPHHATFAHTLPHWKRFLFLSFPLFFCFRFSFSLFPLFGQRFLASFLLLLLIFFNSLLFTWKTPEKNVKMRRGPLMSFLLSLSRQRGPAWGCSGSDSGRGVALARGWTAREAVHRYLRPLAKAKDSLSA